MNIGIYVTICQGKDAYGNTWKSEDIIKSEINSGSYGFQIVDAYFDAEDYDIPIKEYPDDFIWDSLVYDLGKQVSMHVRENTMQLQDSIFSYSPDANVETFICKLYWYYYIYKTNVHLYVH